MKKLARQIVSEISTDFHRKINDLSLNEAKAVLKRANELTETNCGWYEYWLKGSIIKFATDHINQIKHNAKIERKAAITTARQGN